MNLWRKCTFLLAVPAALFVSCMDGEETNPTTNIVFYDVDRESIGSTSAVIKSSYLAYGNDAVAEVGIMYAENDSSEFTYIPAAGISNKFTAALTGLKPSTSYVAKAYVKTESGKFYSGTPTCIFTTTAGNSGEFDIAVSIGEISGISAGGAVFSGSYAVTGTGEPVVSAGFEYRRDGSSDWTSVTASGVSSPFSHTVSGLAAETKYFVRAWVSAGGEVYESPESAAKSFTTLANGVVPNPPVNQFLWGELPVMEEMDDVVYVTHYVTSNGQSDASPTTKGRVRNYTLCYDESKLQPYWVAYPMHSWYNGGVGRNDSWKYDPYINTNAQPNLSSSYNGNYSRGHHVASSDRQKTVAMNKQTFYYSNMSPQIGNEFNGGLWNSLEEKVQSWGWGCSDTLYVVTGSAFIGTLRTTTDKNGNTVPVPSHYYKVLLSSKTGKTDKSISQLSASELRCVGFWFEHRNYGTKDKVTTAYMKKVSDIEEFTGFTFFPMLSEEAESVKKSYQANDWGM